MEPTGVLRSGRAARALLVRDAALPPGLHAVESRDLPGVAVGEDVALAGVVVVVSALGAEAAEGACGRVEIRVRMLAGNASETVTGAIEASFVGTDARHERR